MIGVEVMGNDIDLSTASVGDIVVFRDREEHTITENDNLKFDSDGELYINNVHVKRF